MVRSGVAKQYAAALAGNLAAVACGVAVSWSSPALGTLDLSDEQASWVGSLVALGAAVGPWLGGWGADRLGRRGVLLWGALPALVGWVTLMCAEHQPGLLCAARFVCGVAVGIVFAALPMYTGELAQPSVRGALGTLMQLTISVGMLLVYCAGPFISYLALASIGFILPAVFLVLFFWMPETPYHHLRKGDVAAAEKSLRWFRDEGQDISSEFKLMKEAVDEQRRSEGSVAADLFRVRGNAMALLLSLGLVLFQQLSGICVVLFYGQAIFDMADVGMEPALSQMVVGAVMVLASFVTPLAADRLGRKPLLLMSAAGMVVSGTALGAYFYLLETGKDVSSLGWLPITSLVAYILLYSPGFGALPWAVMGELFPTNVKALASSLTASFCWIVAFFVTKFFGQIAQALGTYIPFWFCAASCVVAGLFVAFLLPETKGKRLEEIQDILNKRRSVHTNPQATAEKFHSPDSNVSYIT